MAAIKTIDKETALMEWAKQNPFLTDSLLFNYLQGHSGSCSLSPISQNAVIKKYIDGTMVKEYRFALQIMLTVTDAVDDTNTQNIFTLRKWQDWIEQMEHEKNYPDFGDKCSGYRLENLSNMPALALQYQNNIAKYQFFARIIYKEAK